MEDTLRVLEKLAESMMGIVLILVLMEDTLRAAFIIAIDIHIVGLNPCFNGRYSQRSLIKAGAKSVKSLNPCFNGRYSQRKDIFSLFMLTASLNPCFNGRYSQSQ